MHIKIISEIYCIALPLKYINIFYVHLGEVVKSGSVSSRDSQSLDSLSLECVTGIEENKSDCVNFL